MQIKNIIFDLGGVIIIHQTRHNFEADTISLIFGSSFKDSEKAYNLVKRDWVTGKINSKRAIGLIKRSLNSSKNISVVTKKWQAIYESKTKINNPILVLAKKLKRNYKIYILTDTNDLHYEVNLKRGMLGYFDDVFCSFMFGTRKPHKVFFKSVLKKIKSAPNECIFIDNKLNNVQAASSLGINAIIYTNYKNLLYDLKSLNIILNKS